MVLVIMVLNSGWDRCRKTKFDCMQESVSSGIVCFISNGIEIDRL